MTPLNPWTTWSGTAICPPWGSCRCSSGNGSHGTSLGQRILSSPYLKLSALAEALAAEPADTLPVDDLDLVVFKNPKDPITEALRHTQTSIMLSASGRPPCILMITSANPSEGKTTIASNLAQSFAV